MQKMYMNLTHKKINKIEKETNNLALNNTKIPLSNNSFKNILGRIDGIRKGCSTCGK